MADTRQIVLVRALVNGFPVMGSLEGFSPPAVEKTTEDNKGGRFIGHKTVVGAELGDWSLTLTTSSPELIKSMADGDGAEVTVMQSIKGDDGVEVPRQHQMSGEILKAEDGEIKPGKEGMTLSGSPYAYTLTENGQVVHDINAKTQKCVVGGKDLLADARRNVDLA